MHIHTDCIYFAFLHCLFQQKQIRCKIRKLHKQTANYPKLSTLSLQYPSSPRRGPLQVLHGSASSVWRWIPVISEWGRAKTWEPSNNGEATAIWCWVLLLQIIKMLFSSVVGHLGPVVEHGWDWPRSDMLQWVVNVVYLVFEELRKLCIEYIVVAWVVHSYMSGFDIFAGNCFLLLTLSPSIGSSQLCKLSPLGPCWLDIGHLLQISKTLSV